ncbi:MAG: hypothetical protein C4K48_10005 [Candidatus Thorarchaeota archaeon]|nr:MAG: hypothetical protein C4K48_10005 [Candidatus Thorarchaeota archaeon]
MTDGSLTEKRQNYLEWMKRSRRTSDLNTLRHIVLDSSSWKTDSGRLDETLFEKTFCLSPLPNRAVTPMLLNKALNYERVIDEITTRMRPLKPIGETLREQVKSLLPKTFGRKAKEVKEEENTDEEAVSEVAEENEESEEAESLTYALSRIVTEHVPRAAEWSVVMPGLDSLSAAILSIYFISRIVDQSVPWLYSLWVYMMEEVKIDALDRALGVYSGKFSWDDLATRLRQAKELINEALGQDPKLDGSIAQPDPLSRKMNEWHRRIESRNSDSKKLRTALRREISDELAMLKGFSVHLQEEIDVRSVSATRLDVLALRPDGPVANKYEKLLQLFRREINLLQYAPLTKLCMNLSKRNTSGNLNANELEQVSQFRGRTAYYALQKLEHFLHERYIPSLRKLGLRFRYIFTPLQRSEILNDGLVERMVLTEQKVRGCAVYVEPSQTKGPDVSSLSGGSYESVVEDEIISMNLDYFDMQTGKWNLENIGDTDSAKKKRKKRIIEYSTLHIDSKPFSLTERQTELLSILWRFEGSKTQRRWLLDQVDFPIRTANRLLHQMMHDYVLNRVYFPALEFCGLPDGLMAVANCYDRRSRDSLIDDVTGRLPFVRLLVGNSNDVVAHIQVPAKKNDHVAGILRDIMGEASDSSFTARLKSSQTYRMSVLHQIRDRDSQSWKDIWSTQRRF